MHRSWQTSHTSLHVVRATLAPRLHTLQTLLGAWTTLYALLTRLHAGLTERLATPALQLVDRHGAS